MDNKKQTMCDECKESPVGEYGDLCPSCCDHSDMDDFICLLCGEDRTDDIMSAAYDRAKDLRKYGH